ncbi:HNH endonuclease [Mesobacillus maritimus]|uniref:HNH endonuclease n=1 Tax=Mesobacillus maritimus TaxID=1643336 RepID=A0ABS7K8P0_9BACI|nr:HNH endonuclease [Mesobacillus maritimus]MBY0098632.1 HNH endonuclease [Mesobacillus maritimus]
MAFFRIIGKGVGKVAGSLIRGSVKLAGRTVKSVLIAGTTKESNRPIGTLGQIIDGVVKGPYEVFSKNETVKVDGKDDLKGLAFNALTGGENPGSYSIKTVGAAYGGQKGDNEKLAEGFVAVMAVGGINPFKEIDVEKKSTKAEQLSNNKVPFVEKKIELPIGEVTGTFPVFVVGFEVQLPEALYLQSDLVHFSYANVELFHAIKSNPDLIHELGLDAKDIEELVKGKTPDGYAWHHHEEAGKLQLVDKDFHQHNGHTGGRELWGGGFENR